MNRAVVGVSLILFLCLIASCLVSGKRVSEKEVLMRFKSSVFDPSGILSSWTSNDSHHCSWFGVSCDSGSRIVAINVTGCRDRGNFPHFYGFGIRGACPAVHGKLGGKLSPLVGKLTHLRILSLAWNDLSGGIPFEIWGLEKLQVLDLEGNSFGGKLPPEFVGLRKLRVLNLGFNRIGGNITDSLSKCVDLEVLSLAGNMLKGLVPEFLGSFSKIKVLYLSNNWLNVSIPENIGGNCSYLEHLDLSGNFLTGRIPGSLGYCRRLRTLLLFSNMLSGIIPREFGWLQKLEILDVSRNNLSGSIPPELGHCLRLSVLVLSNLYNPIPTSRNTNPDMSHSLVNDDHNKFEGAIPMGITILLKLKILWAPRANLKGKFPSNWGRCENLEMVNLAENLFSGELAGVFARCKKLQHLDLSSNRLTGELNKILPVPCMTLFDVSGNVMTGSIPMFNFRICPQMTSLILGRTVFQNPLSAYISFFMNKTRAATHLPFSSAKLALIHNFGGNKFSGPIQMLPIAPMRLNRETDYAFLASGNNLNGSFPRSLFGMCERLNGMIINVSNNMLSGQIPSEIGVFCKRLRVLDVSGNQISGDIPKSVWDLTYLVVLNLGGNKLQGQIPDGLHRLKYLKHLSLTNVNLTGAVPSSILQMPSLEMLKVSSNSLSGEILQDLVKQRRLTSLVLNDNKFSVQLPSGFVKMASPSTYNVPLDKPSAALGSKSEFMNCNSVQGRPSFHSCQFVSFAAASSDMTGSNGASQEDAASPVSNATVNKNFNSIEIASIVSASAIFSVLLVLLILFFYMRKQVLTSTNRVSESREITLFVDIDVSLTYENIVEATGNFSANNCIGSGGFGATYKAEIAPGTLLAVKRLAVGRFQGVRQFDAEIKTLGRVRHPNLVKLIGYHASETEMFLIYNYLPGGNLENFIKERTTRAVEWKTIHQIALNIANALTYLHHQCTPKILHRDVKPSNILLDNELNAFLSDFGLSRLLGPSETHATTGVAGTFGYVAPEYAMTCRVSEKADVYSYGIVLLELISDKKALDPSFSSEADGFNIVSWACTLLKQGQAKDVFTARLWEVGPHEELIEMLHLAIKCTIDTLSTRPTMRQVVQQLRRMQPS